MAKAWKNEELDTQKDEQNVDMGKILHEQRQRSIKEKKQQYGIRVDLTDNLIKFLKQDDQLDLLSLSKVGIIKAIEGAYMNNNGDCLVVFRSAGRDFIVYKSEDLRKAKVVLKSENLES